jgi:UDP-N-acetylglucosamine:LPS N-acetylglucosamine transferase
LNYFHTQKLILKQLKRSNLKALVVLGKAASETKTETIDKITLTPHLQSQEMQEAMLQSKIILARSGYSTIMDLATLNKKAIFIPTPGQTEQEYLAGLVMKKGVAFSQSQNKFDLPSALKMSENYSGFKTIENGDQLEKRIDLLVS